MKKIGLIALFFLMLFITACSKEAEPKVENTKEAITFTDDLNHFLTSVYFDIG